MSWGRVVLLRVLQCWGHWGFVKAQGFGKVFLAWCPWQIKSNSCCLKNTLAFDLLSHFLWPNASNFGLFCIKAELLH